MDGVEFKNYLSSVANKVDSLLFSNPKVRKRFVEHITKFLAMFRSHWQALNEADWVYDRRPKESGWIEYVPRNDVQIDNIRPRHISDTHCKNLYSRQPNPLHWFPTHGRGVVRMFSDEYVDGGLIINRNKIRRTDKQELLMCQYVRLAVIYDRFCTTHQDTPLYFLVENRENETVTSLIEREIWSAMTDYHDTDSKANDTEKRLTDKALMAVKADLEKNNGKTNSPDEKPAATRFTKIGTYLWKFYEVTIKAFFDAVLNKISPS